MMHYRDLFIQGTSSFEEVRQAVVQFLQPSGQPVHVEQSPETPTTLYIAQPEALLLKINQVQELTLPPSELQGFALRLRLQPYNLPDEEDQKKMLNAIPEQLVRFLEHLRPQWNLKLLSITHTSGCLW